MKERDQTVDAAARFAIDELDALGRKADERPRKIVDDEAEVVQGRAAALGDEASDTGLRIRRLEQLDTRAVPRRERDAHALVRDEARLVDVVAEQIAIEGNDLCERGHRDRDVMQLASADPFHARGG